MESSKQLGVLISQNSVSFLGYFYTCAIRVDYFKNSYLGVLEQEDHGDYFVGKIFDRYLYYENYLSQNYCSRENNEQL